MGQTDLLKQINTRKQAIFGLFVVAVTIFSTFYAAIAMAAPLTVMSITPTSGSTEATNVNYTLTFTPDQNAGAVVIDFCDNTPVLGQSCTGPLGLDVDAVTAGSGGHTIDVATDTNTIVAVKAGITADTPETLTFNGITNPTDAEPIYARIVTYANSTNAAGYTDTNPGAVGPVVDNGSVSMYFNDTVVVQGTVLETMTFCVSSAVITANCANATTPTVTLGEGVPKALVAGTVSTGSIHTQMNTNASGGAVVRLKSSSPCGAIMRQGTTNCDIAAALQAGVLDDNNTAAFGVRLNAVTTAVDAVNPIGTLAAYDIDGVGGTPAYYDTTNYYLNWNDDDSVGVTSVIGDPLLYTAGEPATGQNMELTFAATIGTDTPAGIYSTDLSLIAVGTF